LGAGGWGKRSAPVVCAGNWVHLPSEVHQVAVVGPFACEKLKGLRYARAQENEKDATVDPIVAEYVWREGRTGRGPMAQNPVRLHVGKDSELALAPDSSGGRVRLADTAGRPGRRHSRNDSCARGRCPAPRRQRRVQGRGEPRCVTARPVWQRAIPRSCRASHCRVENAETRRRACALCGSPETCRCAEHVGSRHRRGGTQHELARGNGLR
jgi:hypothetical protein